MTAKIEKTIWENGVLIEKTVEIGNAEYRHWDEWRKFDKALGAEVRLYGGNGFFEKYITKMGNKKVFYKLVELIYN